MFAQRLPGISTAALLALAVTAPAGPAIAAESAADLPRFEITPWVGYRFGGEFQFEPESGEPRTVEVLDSSSFGIDLGLYRDASSFYELLFASQSAPLDTRGITDADFDLRTDYFHIGGTLLFAQDNGLVPWVSVTGGVTRLDPSGTAQGETLSRESDFSMSFGGGVRVPLNRRLAVVGGVRAYVTFVDPSSRIFCVSAGGATCLFQFSGSTYWQFEGQLGLALTF